MTDRKMLFYKESGQECTSTEELGKLKIRSGGKKMLNSLSYSTALVPKAGTTHVY